MESIEWIKDVIYLLPIAGLIWKAATLSAKVKQHEAYIMELKSETKDSNKEILSKLDSINDKINEMQKDIAVLKEKVENNDDNNETKN